MILLYTVPSCTSSKKAELWLQAHALKYRKINLMTDKITADEIRKILSLTEKGTDEIISCRSKAYKNLNVHFDELTIDELIQLIMENPTLLRRPLILDDTRLQVGYNEDEIRKFLSCHFRSVKLKKDLQEIRKIAEANDEKESQLLQEKRRHIKKR